MNLNLISAVGASLLVSLISLIGIVSLFFQERFLKKIVIFLVAFGAGGLIGGAFLHLLPEALEHATNTNNVFLCVVAGMVIFFVLERYLHWRHCHQGEEGCHVHPFTYLSLIGDGLHNLIDGLLIGATFATDIQLGWATTIAVLVHEIPQELGDFGVLIHGGFSKTKALFFNFLSACTAIVGSVIGFYISQQLTLFTGLLLPLAAGGFIYIASSDLIPELHKDPDLKEATKALLFFLFGIGLMAALRYGH